MTDKDHKKFDNGNKSSPPFYQSITPLFSETHGTLNLKPRTDHSFASNATGIVLAVEEFPVAQRDYPIVFSKGERVMPVALTGVPGAGNQFVAPNGKWRGGAYIPAYVRRYPFILARLNPETDDLTLCFDSESDLLVKGRTGNLFDGDKPSGRTKAILQLCEWFEGAILKTEQFVAELETHDLLMDAQADIRLAGQEPALFHGFRVVSEAKYKELSEAEIRQLAKSGALALIHAHLFSLKNIERLFARHHSGEADDAAKEKKTKAA